MFLVWLFSNRTHCFQTLVSLMADQSVPDLGFRNWNPGWKIQPNSSSAPVTHFELLTTRNWSDPIWMGQLNLKLFHWWTVLVWFGGWKLVVYCRHHSENKCSRIKSDFQICFKKLQKSYLYHADAFADILEARQMVDLKMRE